MAIYYPLEQRSADWYLIRIGKPTASEFHRILTPGGKLSEQSVDYARTILAEMMLGKPLDSAETQWMIRGQELEDKAIEAYEFATGQMTGRGGFVTTDNGRVGCSPDRLVGEDGLVEMKCPAPNTHVGYLLNPDSLANAKKPQVQGELAVTGRKWVDLVAYHPELPLVVKRVYRDEQYIAKLSDALGAFVAVLDDLRLKLERDYGPFPTIEMAQDKPKEVPEDDGLGVSDEDVEAIWNASQSV